MSQTLAQLQSFASTHATSSAASNTPVVELNDRDLRSMGYPTVKGGRAKAPRTSGTGDTPVL